MANCPACGCYVGAKAKFCPSCGVRIQPGSAPAQEATSPVDAAPVLEESAPVNWYESTEVVAQEEPPCREEGISIIAIYRRCGELLRARPIKLWGLSLLNLLLMSLTCILAPLPIIFLPIAFALYVGMEAIYLEGIYGAEPETEQLFRGFAKGSFLRYAAGMGWLCLWVLIWSLIPIAGVVFGVIKAYSYRFVPYIMLSDPEVNALEALKRSKEMTLGYKAKMFGADALVAAALLVLVLVLVLLSNIHYIGFIFAIVLAAVYLAAIAFLPIFSGLVRACFYDEIEKKM